MSKTQRLLRLALATFTSIAVIAMLAMPFAGGTASAALIEPETVEGNPTCGDFTDGGIEFKIEKSAELSPGDSGQYTDGLLVVDLTIRNTEQGPVFDWVTNFGVDVVVAKGGPMANVYRYDPIETADSGLHAPLNDGSGKWYGLSHVSFCYLKGNATTTTTTTTLETTSTESKVSSTTESPTTSTPAKTTSTEEAVQAISTTTSTTLLVLPTQITATTAPTATSAAPTTTTTLAETLPFTGMSSPTLWVLAVSLLGAGVTALLIARGEAEGSNE